MSCEFLSTATGVNATSVRIRVTGSRREMMPNKVYGLSPSAPGDFRIAESFVLVTVYCPASEVPPDSVAMLVVWFANGWTKRISLSATVLDWPSRATIWLRPSGVVRRTESRYFPRTSSPPASSSRSRTPIDERPLAIS